MVITAGSPPGKPGSTNALRIHQLGDAIHQKLDHAGRSDGSGFASERAPRQGRLAQTFQGRLPEATAQAPHHPDAGSLPWNHTCTTDAHSFSPSSAATR